MPLGNILVADDDAAIRMVLNQALSRAGYNVRLTSNASTLWRWISQGEGDLVITDVVMPDENIFDVLPRIKKTRPQPGTRPGSDPGSGFDRNRDILRNTRIILLQMADAERKYPPAGVLFPAGCLSAHGPQSCCGQFQNSSISCARSQLVNCLLITIGLEQAEL